jgi:hypothetical protein
MTDNEYLAKKLEEQTLQKGGVELTDLEKRGDEVKTLLENHFSDSSPKIKYGGSKAKGTMIKEAYDLDIICYFPRDDEDAGGTLKEIYENTEAALQGSYRVERKASALRLRDKAGDEPGQDFQIDVVPGRYIDGKTGDVFIYQHAAEKERLKTNLEKHISHVRDSGVADPIRLMKLWRCRNGLTIKNFVLELLIIDLLSGKKANTLTSQLSHVWKKFRDDSENLSVTDPANENNDLSELLKSGVRSQLSSVAGSTLNLIETSGWEAVFGKLEDSGTGDEKKEKLRAAVAAVSRPTKPWAG